MLNKKTKYVWLTAFALILSFSAFSMMTSAHSPKFIDVKFYLDDQILSVYYTHGVSNTSYHYIETVQFQFFNLSSQFDTDIDHLIATGELENRTYIEEHHVQESHLIEEVTFNITYTEQESEDHEHQIFHHNYTVADYVPTLNVTYWDYIRVTGYCNLGGQFTKNEIAGQIWYDIEHSMIEAVVPTLICSVVVLTPLGIWAIIGKRREKRKATDGEHK
ncbi:MAG: hypothetical protein ACTSRE_07230 [Promethearchaeota archaeon]